MATKTPAKRKPSISAAHKADLLAIQNEMLRLAEDEGFCDLFYRTVEKLNKTLNQPLALGRKVKADINITFDLVNVRMEGDGYDRFLADENAVLKSVMDALKKAGFVVSDPEVTDVRD